MRESAYYELEQYYKAVRQVGHTSAAIRALKNTPDAKMVVHNNDMAEYLSYAHGISRDRFISAGAISCGTLRGRSVPLVVDNCVVLDILMKLREYREENERLQEERDEVKRKLKDIVSSLKG